ncbi:MAG: CoA pyrophosphatase [bacterium]
MDFRIHRLILQAVSLAIAGTFARVMKLHPYLYPEFRKSTMMPVSFPTTQEFTEVLRAALVDGLPGRDAQFVMAPSARPPEPPHELTPAGVIVALYPDNGSWYFPLIHRVDDGYPHGGQISLPGGRLEPGESVETGALREAQEEIGLSPDRLTVLGTLTPLPIPVSGYTATPIIAVHDGTPDFRLQPREVQAVLAAGLDELANPSNQHMEMRVFEGRESTAPFFILGGRKVWGATAMMLAEFRNLLHDLTI